MGTWTPQPLQQDSSERARHPQGDTKFRRHGIHSGLRSCRACEQSREAYKRNEHLVAPRLHDLRSLQTSLEILFETTKNECISRSKPWGPDQRAFSLWTYGVSVNLSKMERIGDLLWLATCCESCILHVSTHRNMKLTIILGLNEDHLRPRSPLNIAGECMISRDLQATFAVRGEYRWLKRRACPEAEASYG